MADTGVQNEDANSRALPLDDNLYTLDEETSDFFMAQTGIQDAEELKKHLLRVQAQAYAVRSYVAPHGPTSFMRRRSSHIHAYAGSYSLSKCLNCDTRWSDCTTVKLTLAD